VKKRFLILIFLIVLVIISGCGLKGEDVIKIAEESVKQELKDLQEYNVKATKAVQYVGIWDVTVNVTIIEKTGQTRNEIKGYYLVKVNPKGKVLSVELKKMGSFET